MSDPVKNEESRTGPEPNERLVPVFDAKDDAEALVVRGLLESQGIEAMLSGSDAERDLWPGGTGGCVIRVREERADDARRIIAEYRDAPPLEETDITDDSAAQG
jgi:putative signal transducing protein